MSEWREVSLHEHTWTHLLECIKNEHIEYTSENKWDNEYELWRLFEFIKEDLIINEVIEPED
jgi:hypothetical protein